MPATGVSLIICWPFLVKNLSLSGAYRLFPRWLKTLSIMFDLACNVASNNFLFTALCYGSEIEIRKKTAYLNEMYIY